jgi:uroporphyrinogen-III synthase
LGVKADILVPEPNTWREILAAVAVRPERRILVQEYGRPNLELTATLEGLGAQVTPLVVYKWELPDDCEPLREAARQLAARTFDVVMFTSSIQLEHLLQIAREQGVEAQVIDALRHYTAVASVGPVMSDSLRAAGLPVDIEPAHPKMAPLTKAALTGAGPVLTAKRG